MTIYIIIGILSAACLFLWQSILINKKDIKYKDLENETIKKKTEALQRAKEKQQDILNIASDRASYDAKRRSARLRKGTF